MAARSLVSSEALFDEPTLLTRIATPLPACAAAGTDAGAVMSRGMGVTPARSTARPAGPGYQPSADALRAPGNDGYVAGHGQLAACAGSFGWGESSVTPTSAGPTTSPAPGGF